MSKRKKQPRNTGEGLQPTKHPKNPRLRDAPESPQSSAASQDNSGPISSAELSGEEPGQTVSSYPVEEIEAVSSLLGTPEPPLPSQTSVRRFVPQFARSKKTVPRRAEAREEDRESGAVGWEPSPEPGVLTAASLPSEESLGLPLQEAVRPEDQMQEAGAVPGQSGLSSAAPAPDDGHACSEVTVEGDPGPSDSERASQDPPLDVGAVGSSSRPETETACVPGILGPEKRLPGADAAGEEPDSRGPQEEGARGAGSGTEPGGGPQDEGDDVLRIPELASDPDTPCVTGSAAQCFLVPTQLPRGTGWEADLSTSSPACTPLGDSVTTDVSLDPSELQQRAVEVAVPGGRVPGRGCCGEVLLGCTQLAGESAAGGEEARLEEEPSGGDMTQPVARKAAEPGGQNCEPSLGDVSMPTTGLLEHSYTPRGTPVDLLWQQVLDAADEATWPDTSTTELDFLPDSQMQEALDAPDLEAPPEPSFPAGSKPDLDWPDCSAHIRGDLSSVAKAQSSRPHVGPEAQKACRMQDATDTVRGLIMELSNLNRLIMIAHRDLEACKRRKAKVPGKAPLPYLSKGLGTLSRGEQGWKDP